LSESVLSTARVFKVRLLKLDEPLKITNQRVKVILLIPESNELNDTNWLQTISSNAAFDFLNHEEEDI